MATFFFFLEGWGEWEEVLLYSESLISDLPVCVLHISHFKIYEYMI